MFGSLWIKFCKACHIFIPRLTLVTLTWVPERPGLEPQELYLTSSYPPRLRLTHHCCREPEQCESAVFPKRSDSARLWTEWSLAGRHWDRRGWPAGLAAVWSGRRSRCSASPSLLVVRDACCHRKRSPERLSNKFQPCLAIRRRCLETLCLRFWILPLTVHRDPSAGRALHGCDSYRRR